MMTPLPADVHKCSGLGSDAEGWREGCEDCLRRLAPPAQRDRVWWMSPPAVVAFWCESHIPTSAAPAPEGEPPRGRLVHSADDAEGSEL